MVHLDEAARKGIRIVVLPDAAVAHEFLITVADGLHRRDRQALRDLGLSEYDGLLRAVGNSEALFGVVIDDDPHGLIGIQVDESETACVWFASTEAAWQRPRLLLRAGRWFLNAIEDKFNGLYAVVRRDDDRLAKFLAALGFRRTADKGFNIYTWHSAKEDKPVL